MQTGAIIFFDAEDVPKGYLLCNGSEVSKEDYIELYNYIGDKYGTPVSEDNFLLPNLIDKFIQGSTVSGTNKEAGLPNITGWFKVAHCSVPVGGSGVFQCISANPVANYVGSTAGKTHTISIDASLSSMIYGNSDTVQPPALTMLPCIKY